MYILETLKQCIQYVPGIRVWKSSRESWMYVSIVHCWSEVLLANMGMEFLFYVVGICTNWTFYTIIYVVNSVFCQLCIWQNTYYVFNPWWMRCNWNIILLGNSCKYKKVCLVCFRENCSFRHPCRIQVCLTWNILNKIQQQTDTDNNNFYLIY